MRPMPFPAMRRWHAGATPAEFRRIAPATRIYRADDVRSVRRRSAAHGLGVRPREARDGMREHRGAWVRRDACSTSRRARCTCGPSRGAPRPDGSQPPAAVYRIPLDGSAPSALRTAGSPVDQFSFLEERRHAQRAGAIGRPRRRHVGGRRQCRRPRAAARAARALRRRPRQRRPRTPTARCRGRAATRCRTATWGRICSTAAARAGARRRRPATRRSTPCATPTA